MTTDDAIPRAEEAKAADAALAAADATRAYRKAANAAKLGANAANANAELLAAQYHDARCTADATSAAAARAMEDYEAAYARAVEDYDTACAVANDSNYKTTTAVAEAITEIKRALDSVQRAEDAIDRARTMLNDAGNPLSLHGEVALDEIYTARCRVKEALAEITAAEKSPKGVYQHDRLR